MARGKTEAGCSAALFRFLELAQKLVDRCLCERVGDRTAGDEDAGDLHTWERFPNTIAIALYVVPTVNMSSKVPRDLTEV